MLLYLKRLKQNQNAHYGSNFCNKFTLAKTKPVALQRKKNALNSGQM